MRIETNSIKFKVSVLYTVVLGVILTAFSVALHTALSYYLYQDVDARLRVRANETINNIKTYQTIIGDAPEALSFAVQKTFFYDVEYPVNFFEVGRIRKQEMQWLERADMMGLGDSFVAFVPADRQRIITTKNFPSRLLSAFLTAKVPAKTDQMFFSNIRYKKSLFRVVTVPYFHGKQKNMIYVGVSQGPVVYLLNSLAQAQVIAIPLVLLLTSFVGLLFVRRILDPIEEIAQTANKITHEDLSSRVKTKHLDTEVQYLVDAFNDMITRLERSFKHVNDFSSHVAHELKTPLAIIKGESEVILSKERDREEYKAAIRITLEEADRMRKTVEDLLLLAKLDYQPEVFRFEPFDFKEFFEEVCEQARILATDRGLTVKTFLIDQPMEFKGDKLHLRRLFFNMIDNACKYTPAPGEVRLSAAHLDDKLVISIADTGVGIPEEDLEKIFEQFYHFDRTGSDATAGNGLGLSIVKSIINIHNGHIEVESKVGQGTSFHITFPL
jgi:two-component system, OmpR family, heavy metal sensor histidine kinase CusS